MNDESESEYDRLKRQRDDIVRRQAALAAEAIEQFIETLPDRWFDDTRQSNYLARTNVADACAAFMLSWVTEERTTS